MGYATLITPLRIICWQAGDRMFHGHRVSASYDAYRPADNQVRSLRNLYREICAYSERTRYRVTARLQSNG
jgi:hypothetical protein